MWHDAIEPSPTYDEMWQEILDLGAQLDRVCRELDKAWLYSIVGWIAFAFTLSALMIAL